MLKILQTMNIIVFNISVNVEFNFIYPVRQALSSNNYTVKEIYNFQRKKKSLTLKQFFSKINSEFCYFYRKKTHFFQICFSQKRLNFVIFTKKISSLYTKKLL